MEVLNALCENEGVISESVSNKTLAALVVSTESSLKKAKLVLQLLNRILQVS